MGEFFIAGDKELKSGSTTATSGTPLDKVIFISARLRKELGCVFIKLIVAFLLACSISANIFSYFIL